MVALNFTARTSLTAGWPVSLWRSEDSSLHVLTRSADGLVLDEFDDRLRRVRRIQRRDVGNAVRDVARHVGGGHWLLTKEGARLLGPDLSLSAPVREPDDHGLELQGIAVFGDDLLLVRQHSLDAAQAPGMLSRISADGEVRWSTRLPPTDLAHRGVVEMRADDDWQMRAAKPWQPTTWLLCSKSIPISEGRALLTFSETPRSGIGLGYVASLTDGQILYTTGKGPISEIAAHSDGRFLVGYQGYGDFKTLLYGRDGTVEDEWPSHGFYIVDGCDVQVVEMENVLPSKMRLARLEDGGRVRYGPKLGGYYTSKPLVREDRSLFFVRDGCIFLCRDLQVLETASISGANERTLGTAAVEIEAAVFVAVQVGGEAWQLLRIDVS
jgi:hypothetical protein